jgi:hypothetical protein
MNLICRVAVGSIHWHWITSGGTGQQRNGVKLGRVTRSTLVL